MVAKSSEQSSKQLEDNSVDISKKRQMIMNQLSTRVPWKAARLGKIWNRALPREKSKKSQGKRKASFASESTTKRPKKWSWTSEAVEILLKYIKEFKTKCEFNGVDFEADLSTLYAEIRRCMAVDFSEDFGAEIVQEPGKELQDMNSDFACPPFWLFELSDRAVVSLGAKFSII